MGKRSKTKQIMRSPSKNKTYIGYCHSERHKGFLTSELVKEHQCTNQGYIDESGEKLYRVCPRLEKFEEAAYWKKKERAKMMRRLQKEAAEHNISSAILNDAARKYNYNENLIRIMLYLPTNKQGEPKQ